MYKDRPRKKYKTWIIPYQIKNSKPLFFYFPGKAETTSQVDCAKMFYHVLPENYPALS